MTDAELLSRYAAEQSEPAFAELTGRHVDLVYSAALRLMNGDVHSAEDVTQQVFTEVARQARRLARHPAFVGWLYTATRQIAWRVNRTDQRRLAREQDAHAMNQLLHDDSPPADWNRLRPVIEDVMHELDDCDRHAVLLRFFQKKSLDEVGAALNLTGNTARMRVDRALDKLREKLARRGITTTAGALAVVLAANAVQAAPVGFAVTISAAAVAGGSVHASTFVAATKTIAMTTLQKTIVTAALAVAVGTGIYAIHQKEQLQEQIRSLQKQQAPLTAQIRQLEEERDAASNRLGRLSSENARLKTGSSATEVMALRGQVGQLRQRVAASDAANAPASGLDKMMSDPAMNQYLRQAQKEKIQSLYTDLFKELKLTPEQSDGVLQLLCDQAGRSLAQMTAPGSQPAPYTPMEMAAQLRTLLGDAGLARFGQYSEEIPARTTINMLNTQLGDSPLAADQSAQLLQVIKAQPNELTRGITGAPDRAFLGSQADIDKFLQQVADSNQQILQQAGSFLKADQLAALDAMLTKAIEARRLQAAALLQKH